MKKIFVAVALLICVMLIPFIGTAATLTDVIKEDDGISVFAYEYELDGGSYILPKADFIGFRPDFTVLSLNTELTGPANFTGRADNTSTALTDENLTKAAEAFLHYNIGNGKYSISGNEISFTIAVPELFEPDSIDFTVDFKGTIEDSHTLLLDFKSNSDPNNPLIKGRNYSYVGYIKDETFYRKR